MGNVKDFIIEDGELKKYRGKDANVIIPDGINGIGSYAFQRQTIETVVIPDSVTVIRKCAFIACKNLRRVQFSRNLRFIHREAFSGCSALEQVELYEGLKEIENHAFQGCSIESIVIPDSVKLIGKDAFKYCKNLKSVQLPKNLRTNGGSAFYGCNNISEVVYPGVSPSILWLFWDLPKLYDEDGFLVINDVLLDRGRVKSKRCVVPNGVKRIVNISCEYPEVVSSLTIPDTVEVIDDRALTCLRFDKRFWFRYKPSDAKEARRLVMKVFDWERLVNLYLNNSLRGDDLFIDAVKDLIGSVPGRRKIWSWYIYDEPSRMSRFLDCCKRVPLDELDRAIKKAKSLTVIALLIDYKNSKYTVQEIEAYESDLMDKKLGLKERTLADVRKEFKVVKKNDKYVITGYKEDAAAEEFYLNKDYYNVVVVPAKISGVEVVVGRGAFEKCDYVNEVIVEDGVVWIGNYAFYDCSRLRAVHLPSSVKRFGSTRIDDGAGLCTGGHRFTVYAPLDSDAYWEAKRHNLEVVVEN